MKAMMLKLDSKKIMRDVIAANGLGRFLDEGLENRFDQLIDKFNEFGSIDQHAFVAAVSEFTRIIDNRLRLARDWELYPEILQQEIKQPFFVIGNARAGTTFAQSILTLDEGHRTPCYWDTRNPTPPPGMDPSADIAAHREAEQFLDYMLGKSPGLWPAHPYFDQKGYTEAEDEFLYSTDLNMAYPLHYLKVPTMPQCEPATDSVEALEFLKKMFKQLQWKLPVKRWVGKGILHQYVMPSLLEVFPDAVCFWMHRPPEEYIASLLELLERQYKPFNGDLYRVEGRDMADQLHAGIVSFLSNPIIDDPRINHIRFADFIKDPASVIAPIYEKNGIEFTADFENRIKQRVKHPSFRADRHGKFEYSLEKFNLNSADLRRQFSDYCERFSL